MQMIKNSVKGQNKKMQDFYREQVDDNQDINFVSLNLIQGLVTLIQNIQNGQTVAGNQIVLTAIETLQQSMYGPVSDNIQCVLNCRQFIKFLQNSIERRGIKSCVEKGQDELVLISNTELFLQYMRFVKYLFSTAGEQMVECYDTPYLIHNLNFIFEQIYQPHTRLFQH